MRPVRTKDATCHEARTPWTTYAHRLNGPVSPGPCLALDVLGQLWEHVAVGGQLLQIRRWHRLQAPEDRQWHRLHASDAGI